MVVDLFAHLQTFADVAIATTAMSAILIAVRADRMGDPRFVWALGGLLSWALAALFFALLPMVLQAYGMDTTSIWRFCLIGIAIHASTHTIGFATYDHALLKRGIDLDSTQHSRPIKARPATYLIYSILGAFSVWVAYAASSAPIAGNYFLSLTAQIVFAFWLFVSFLMTYTPKRPTT
jgi:hypothetical protein